MRILLDENMPRKLLAALVTEGHEVDSVKSLHLQGIDNGALYELIPQTRQDEFVDQFMTAFLRTDWSSHKSGDDWSAAGQDR